MRKPRLEGVGVTGDSSPVLIRDLVLPRCSLGLRVRGGTVPALPSTARAAGSGAGGAVGEGRASASEPGVVLLCVEPSSGKSGQDAPTVLGMSDLPCRTPGGGRVLRGATLFQTVLGPASPEARVLGRGSAPPAAPLSGRRRGPRGRPLLLAAQRPPPCGQVCRPCHPS